MQIVTIDIDGDDVTVTQQQWYAGRPGAAADFGVGGARVRPQEMPAITKVTTGRYLIRRRASSLVHWRKRRLWAQLSSSLSTLPHRDCTFGVHERHVSADHQTRHHDTVPRSWMNATRTPFKPRAGHRSGPAPRGSNHRDTVPVPWHAAGAGSERISRSPRTTAGVSFPTWSVAHASSAGTGTKCSEFRAR